MVREATDLCVIEDVHILHEGVRKESVWFQPPPYHGLPIPSLDQPTPKIISKELLSPQVSFLKVHSVS